MCWPAPPSPLTARGPESAIRRAAEGVPLLHGARLALATAAALLPRLCRVAGNQETRRIGEALATGVTNPAQLIRASIAQDTETLTDLADSAGVGVGLLSTLAGVASSPLLRACAAELTPALGAEPWRPGYCGICGAWPALAEQRGLERSRRVRCGRCGFDWAIEQQRCPFCDNRDHRRLGSLLLEEQGPAQSLAVCDECRCYLKTLTTLDPLPADEIVVEDLATLELDLVALGREYARPASPGFQVRLAP